MSSDRGVCVAWRKGVWLGRVRVIGALAQSALLHVLKFWLSHKDCYGPLVR